MRRSSSWSSSGSAMSRANVSSWEIEIRSVDSSSGRGSMPRARSRNSRPTLPRRTCCRSPSVIAAMSPIVSIPSRDEALLRARADAWEDPDREGREERRLAAGPNDRQSSRLAPVGGDLRDHLRGRHPERAREPGACPHDGPHRLGERARIVERRRDLAQIEVALVDPCLLDGRHDLAHPRPDLARVVAVERMARADEHRVRAAAERLCGRHRGVDPEATGEVVAGRDDSPALGVAPDDQRYPSQRGVLELLDGGEERVQVEVRDDHEKRVEMPVAGTRWPAKGDNPP